MAVSLVDNYTGEKPVVAVSVTLKGESYKGIKNPSGYYVFLNIPIKAYVVQVRSDYYFDNDFPAALTPPAPGDLFSDRLKKLKQVIPLDPNPAYPFPSGATLIRGIVNDQAGNPVASAAVTIVERGLTAQTTSKGEYVVYLKSLTGGDVNDKGFVETTTNSSTTTMTVRAQVGGDVASVVVDNVAEGASNSAVAIKLNITS